jgi:hypothetical protein
MRDMFIKYSIVEKPTNNKLWCKIKGYCNTDIFSREFFLVFSVVNKIMMARQLKNLKRLSELSATGKVDAQRYNLKNYFIRSGIHWWIFCRRHNCKGLMT